MTVYSKSKKRLKTLADVRRFLAWTVNEVLAGRVPPEVGSKLIYMGDKISATIRDNDLEKKLAEIEELLTQTPQLRAVK